MVHCLTKARTVWLISPFIYVKITIDRRRIEHLLLSFHFFFLVTRALFGYEGQSNVLKVVSSGEDGLIELSDDLNSGKIMYAFVGVEDPKTTLNKYLLINWQVSKMLFLFLFLWVSLSFCNQLNGAQWTTADELLACARVQKKVECRIPIMQFTAVCGCCARAVYTSVWESEKLFNCKRIMTHSRIWYYFSI